MPKITFSKRDVERIKKRRSHPVNKPPLLIVGKRIEKGEYELVSLLEMLYTRKQVCFKVGRKLK